MKTFRQLDTAMAHVRQQTPMEADQAERDEYAEILMKHYPHRVLAYLKTLSMPQLQIVGKASEEEANANYHHLMLDQTKKYGSD